MADFRRDFWIRETGTGQQVAQLHDRYMMMMKFENSTLHTYTKVLRSVCIFVNHTILNTINTNTFAPGFVVHIIMLFFRFI